MIFFCMKKGDIKKVNSKNLVSLIQKQSKSIFPLKNLEPIQKRKVRSRRLELSNINVVLR